jgi:RNA polymerase sigma-70 factor (ECF subfamily)
MEATMSSGQKNRTREIRKKTTMQSKKVFARRWDIVRHFNRYNALDFMTTPSRTLTQLLSAWSDGDKAALEQLMPMVYQELRRLAARHLAREREGHTVQATALVNEAYLRLIEQKHVHWQNKAHFLGIAAQMMRRILVDYARSRRYAKRGGGAPVISLVEAATLSVERASDLIAVHDALTRLSELDARKGRVVELRFFGGLNVEQTAEVLDISPNTVLRDWKIAKAWLHRELSDPVVVSPAI